MTVLIGECQTPPGWVSVQFIPANPPRWNESHYLCPPERVADRVAALRTEQRNQWGEVDFDGWSLKPEDARRIADDLEAAARQAGGS